MKADLVAMLHVLRDAAIDELPVARIDGNGDLVHSLARIFDEAAERLSLQTVPGAVVPVDRCDDCTGLRGVHMPGCPVQIALT